VTEDSGSSSSLIITCISDDSIQFAKEVYEYLYSALERQKTQFTEESKGLNVARDLITLHVKEKGEEERAGEEESQIRIDRLANISKGTIKSILGSFLKSNISRFKDYEVIELGETFTIGRVLPPSKMEMLTCEICGFFTPYSGELYTHRMTHFGI
jgi:hypothetical protein